MWEVRGREGGKREKRGEGEREYDRKKDGRKVSEPSRGGESCVSKMMSKEHPIAAYM